MTPVLDDFWKQLELLERSRCGREEQSDDALLGLTAEYSDFSRLCTDGSNVCCDELSTVTITTDFRQIFIFGNTLPLSYLNDQTKLPFWHLMHFYDNPVLQTLLYLKHN